MINLMELRAALQQLRSYSGKFEDISYSQLQPALQAVNFNGQEINGLRIENRTDDPANPVVGQIWLRVDL